MSEADENAPAKRLTARTHVVRELYLLSGNECAFPGCQRRMINEKGQFIGQICHIEAAEEGGERFNPNQTDEDRRSVTNLMLMCYEHHVETNDVAEFQVARLQQMKAAHEARFRGGLAHLEAAFQDQTALAAATLPTSLRGLDTTLEWGSSEEELAPLVADVIALAKKLEEVPRSSRSLLAVIVRRGRPSGGLYSDVRAMYEDVVQAVGGRRADVDRHIAVLIHHDVIWTDGPYEETPLMLVVRESAQVPVVVMINEFCKKSGTPPELFFVDLQFGELD